MPTGADTRTEADPAARGWYLYGITRPAPLAALAVTDDAAALQLLDCSELTAVVRPVLLADFSPAVLRQRLQSASELEEIVRSHNRVIEAIHARQAILPAKFGSVYARTEDIVSALRSARDTLLPQLRRLEGCDEWAVHLYAHGPVVQERIATKDSSVQRLRDERAAARPGRAYFLEQQLHHAVKAATEEALVTLAQRAFDRLKGYAVAGQVNRIGPRDGTDDVEILRAAFLVARDGAERFRQEVRSSADPSAGLRCEYSGPWPPYSFAARDDEEAR